MGGSPSHKSLLSVFPTQPPFTIQVSRCEGRSSTTAVRPEPARSQKLEGVRPCTLAISLLGSSPLRPESWGHSFAALLFGIDAALRTNATLLLDDDFWDGLRGRGESPRASASASVSAKPSAVTVATTSAAGIMSAASREERWPWRVLSFNRSSQAGALGLGGLTRVGFGEEGAPDVSPATLAREARQLMNARGRAALQQLDKLARLGLGLSFDRCVRERQCRHHYHVHTAMRSCAGGYYCHAHLPGAWHRATSSATFRRALEDGMKRTGWLHAHARSNDGSGGRDRPISIVWHLRTGDAVTAVKEGSLLALNHTVSRQLPHRRAVHTVLTADEAQLRVGWPALSAFCRAPSSVEADVALMAGADVLVTGGSSFGMAAAAIAPIGQLHLFLPPKEAYWGGGRPPIRDSSAFQSYFMPRNTVPLDYEARPLSEYVPKLEAMLRALDEGRRPAAAEAWQHAGEPWLWDMRQKRI